MRVSHQVTLKTSGKQFTVNQEETLLEAALRQGINLPYGCKNGACGSCKGKVIEGLITHGQHSESALSKTDETAGSTLFCCAHPQSDLIIEAREVQGAGAAGEGAAQLCDAGHPRDRSGEGGCGLP